MLRPIDTQIIYQQSQEVSNRQQVAKEGVEMQQAQFSNILHKETAQKQESVVEIREEEKIRNNLDQKQGRGQSQNEKKYKNKKQKDDKKEKAADTCHIDIRI